MQPISEFLNASQADLLFGTVGFVFGVLVMAVAFLVNRQRLLTQNAELKAQIREREIAFNQAEAVLDSRFKATAAEALQKSSEQFLQLAQERLKAAQQDSAHDLEKRQNSIAEMIKPVHKNLEDMARALEQVKGTDIELRKDLQMLNRETARLVGALRDPAAQGRWGEYILEVILDKSGLLEGVHYNTQVSIQTPQGIRRPDAVIDMQDGFKIIIDAKAPINQYVDKLSENLSEAEYKDIAQNLSKQVNARVKDLGKKDYWGSLESLDFTVLFLPSEHIYSIALRANPQLLDMAAENNVVIASPTLLMSLLRVVGLSWRQVELAKNAQEISAQGVELHKRFLKFTDHLTKVGKGLQSAMSNYDSAIGSLQSNVLPAARKFKEFQAGARLEDIPDMELIERTPRSLTLTSDDEEEKKKIA